MKSQQPAYGYGANSNWQNVCLEDEKTNICCFAQESSLQGGLFFVVMIGQERQAGNNSYY